MKKLCIIISLTCTPTLLLPFHTGNLARRTFEREEKERREQDKQRFLKRAENGNPQCLHDFVNDRTRVIGARTALNSRHYDLTLALLRQLPPAFFSNQQSSDSPNRTDEQVCIDAIYYWAQKNNNDAFITCIDEKRAGNT